MAFRGETAVGKVFYENGGADGGNGDAGKGEPALVVGTGVKHCKTGDDVGASYGEIAAAAMETGSISLFVGGVYS